MNQGDATSTDEIKLQKEDARKVLKSRLKGLTKEVMAAESERLSGVHMCVRCRVL